MDYSGNRTNGSGKTTTLYALLSNLNNSEINIITIEDPIEYQIDGIARFRQPEN
jgi:type II secretory ATPase GspE/PulE/Tfp pilus assembly ATPase PilB-like protein